jgi:hypothetical protein
VLEGHDRVSITAVAVPLLFAVDGDLTEWGSLEPPRRPKLPRAASHVALGIREDRVLLAADLRGDARDGAWLGVRAESSGIPEIGVYGPGSGIVPLDCDDAGSAPDCRERVKEHDALAAKKEARMTRVLRIDRDGVRVRAPDGSLVVPATRSNVAPVVRVQASSDGLRVEAELPTSALPSFDLPEIDSIALAAAPLSSDGKLDDDAYAWLALPRPIAFLPHPALRMKAAELFLSGPSPRWTYDPGSEDVSVYAYPGNFSDLEDADTYRVTERVVRLYEKERTFGDLEIGKLLGDAGLVILRGENVVEEREVTPFGMVERDGELHVLAVSVDDLHDGTSGITYPAFAVRPDGTLREEIVPESSAVGFLSVEPSNAADLSSFGYTGTKKESGRTETVTYTYDTKSHVYRATKKVGPAPKVKAKR